MGDALNGLARLEVWSRLAVCMQSSGAGLDPEKRFFRGSLRGEGLFRERCLGEMESETVDALRSSHADSARCVNVLIVRVRQHSGGVASDTRLLTGEPGYRAISTRRERGRRGRRAQRGG